MRNINDLKILLYSAQFRQAPTIRLQSHYLQKLISLDHEVKDLIADPENITEEELFYIKLKDVI
ncbi:hypothetical protein GCM10007868_06970 [Gluconobacter frateurii]|uniref:Uncharacterized protein n=1 Tax=Gluconobacter frateurii NRIC 0228 TaxID=1307946 RepID=A0ABQ0QFQ7_9PROT|nr:hypothetical protein AA0228_3044 [Gluconobacter frateurii NRIC 0228]GLP89622.1 hypothetical protein GCM10007868_06970 [Gluconobacter frateurii]